MWRFICENATKFDNEEWKKNWWKIDRLNGNDGKFDEVF